MPDGVSFQSKRSRIGPHRPKQLRAILICQVGRFSDVGSIAANRYSHHPPIRGIRNVSNRLRAERIALLTCFDDARYTTDQLPRTIDIGRFQCVSSL